MSNNAPATVRNTDRDPRIVRSTRALGRALIELIQERDYDEITVQQILDRAGVGRSTFYAHYRNKNDALLSSYEELFGWASSRLDRPSAVGYRLFPVTEFVGHIVEQHGEGAYASVVKAPRFAQQNANGAIVAKVQSLAGVKAVHKIDALRLCGSDQPQQLAPFRFRIGLSP